MRLILSFLLICFCVAASAQSVSVPYIEATRSMKPPLFPNYTQLNKTTSLPGVAIVYTSADSGLYYRLTVNGPWKKLVNDLDTSIYSLIVDSTGIEYQRVVVAAPSGKLRGYSHFLYDSATATLRIQRIPMNPVSSPSIIFDGAIHGYDYKIFGRSDFYGADHFFPDVVNEPLADTGDVHIVGLDKSDGKMKTVPVSALGGGGSSGINQLDGDVFAGPGSGLQTSTIQANVVDYAKLQQMVGLSVLGRSVNATGNMAPITSATDGHVLRQSGTSLGFGTLKAAALNPTYSNGQIPQTDGSGAITFVNPSLLAWLPTGNSITSANFIGSTNAVSFKIRTNNTQRWVVDSANGFLSNNWPGYRTYVLNLFDGSTNNMNGVLFRSQNYEGYIKLLSGALQLNTSNSSYVQTAGAGLRVVAGANTNAFIGLAAQTSSNYIMSGMSRITTGTTLAMGHGDAFPASNNADFCNLLLDGTIAPRPHTAVNLNLRYFGLAIHKGATITNLGMFNRYQNASLYVDGARAAVTGGGLGNSYAVWVKADVSRFDGAVLIGDTLPNTSAALDVKSISKTMIPPRMTSTQRDAIIQNEIQRIVLSDFNSTTDAFKITYAGNESALIGFGGVGYNSASIKSAIEAITGFTGTVTVSLTGVTYHYFDVEFSGGLANTDVSPFTITSVSGCTGTSYEHMKGGIPAGSMIFCSDCTADDASTGVTQTYSSAAWRNHY